MSLCLAVSFSVRDSQATRRNSRSHKLWAAVLLRQMCSTTIRDVKSIFQELDFFKQQKISIVPRAVLSGYQPAKEPVLLSGSLEPLNDYGFRLHADHTVQLSPGFEHQ